jgi:hypothetical protein
MTLTIEEIKLRKRKGDLSLVADVMGISQGNASKILVRPLAKKHKDLVNIMSQVISMRKMLKNTGSESLTNSR